MKITSGIELLEETVGHGPAATQGDEVTYNARFYLRRGDEVTWDNEIIARARGHLATRRVEDIELIDHVTTLGRRRVIAGVEKTLVGMRAGGFREVLVSPHLAYRDAGVPGRIPPGALLRIRLWVRQLRAGGA
jgi:FKBP-type peptidyl-prolyl cis-trans isomerase